MNNLIHTEEKVKVVGAVWGTDIDKYASILLFL